MNAKTILYIAPALPVGGAEKFLVSLTKGLVDHTGKQILVSLSDNNPLLGEFDKSIEFHSFARKTKFDRKPLSRLRKLIKETQPDYIFCLNFFPYFFARVALMGASVKSKMIISYHSTIQLERKEHLLHVLYSKMLRKKDIIVTVSENQARYTAGKYKIPMSQFNTIRNGIDTSYWKPAAPGWDRSVLLNRFSIPADAKVIVMSAALRPEKNHTGAVRALKILHTQFGRPAYLLLVGGGMMKEEIEKTARETGMEKYVIFAGNQQDVLPFYQSGDLFTLCSHSETFSMAALEALSCGLPGSMTDVGGASEMIKDGFNGFLSKHDDYDIARSWNDCLKTSFSPETIHQYVDSNFSRPGMFREYISFLQLNTETK